MNNLVFHWIPFHTFTYEMKIIQENVNKSQGILSLTLSFEIEFQSDDFMMTESIFKCFFFVQIVES